MRRRPSLELGLGLLVVVLGCRGEEPPTHIGWPDTPLPFALIVEQRGEDSQLVAGPMRVPSEAVLWPVAEDRSLLLAGLTEARLSALHPRVHIDRSPDGFAVLAQSESCERGRALSNGGRSFPLPAAAMDVQVLHGDADAEDIERLRTTMAGWSIEAPLDASVCNPEQQRTAVFTDQVQLLEPGTVIDGQERYPSDPEDTNLYFEMRSGDWISDDAVALSTEHMLFWVERGVPLPDTLDRRLRYSDVLPTTPTGTTWGSRALERAPGQDGILLVGLGGRNPERAALLTIDTRQGRFEVISSSISPGRSITSLAIDEAGRFIVGGRFGQVGIGSVETGLLAWTTLPGEVGNVDHGLSLTVPEPTFLVATAGGSVYTVPWAAPNAARRVELPGDPSGVSSLSGLTGAEATYLILRPNELPILSSDGSSWTQMTVDVPPEARGCAQVADACGEHGFAEIISLSGALDDSAFVLTPRACSGLFRFDPKLRCLDALPVIGRPEIAREPGLRWYGTKRRGERAIAFGEPARLIEISAR